MYGIVCQEMCERFRIRQIIDGDNFNVGILKAGSKEVSSDTSKSIDGNTSTHVNPIVPYIVDFVGEK
jgi:hypothetical protein